MGNQVSEEKRISIDADDALVEEYRREMAARVAEEGTPPTEAGPKITDDYVMRCLDNNELGDGMLFAAMYRNKHVYVGQTGE